MNNLSQKLVEYIKHHADAGHDHQKIANHLVQRGHDPEVVRQAVERAKQASAPTPPTVASTQPQQMPAKSGSSNKVILFIVFGIIGLILLALIVMLGFLFFGTSQLQEGLRDNQRGSDTARLVNEVSSYQSQNDGQLPIDQSQLDSLYQGLDRRPVNPSDAKEYEFIYYTGSDPGFDAKAGRMLFVREAACSEDSAVYNNNARGFAIITLDDNGSDIICRDNS